MISSSDCPKCGMLYVGVITKYLPFIETPVYAEFQPIQKLSYCKRCGFFGTHKVEMIGKESFPFMNFDASDLWTEQELQEFKIKAKQ